MWRRGRAMTATMENLSAELEEMHEEVRERELTGHEIVGVDAFGLEKLLADPAMPESVAWTMVPVR
jgi:hypothetical protein